MKTLKDWQKAAYELAVEKGFHSRRCEFMHCIDGYLGSSEHACPACEGTGRLPVDPHNPTRIASRLALIHCEISEAVECVARGKMELTWERGGDVIPDRVYQTRHTIQPWFDMSRESFVRRVEYIHDGGKPEGFPIELADVFLRLCDLAESLGAEPAEDWDPTQGVQFDDTVLTPEISARMLCDLHDAIPRATRAEVRPGNECDLDNLVHELYGAIELTFWIARAHGVDLFAMAALKHEFNRTRPMRHGGKVL